MKAAYIEQTGPIENIKVGDLPRPEPRPGQVLVKVRAVALNPKNAEALFGRGALKLRMANQAGESDIAAAKLLDPNIVERMALLSIAV